MKTQVTASAFWTLFANQGTQDPGIPQHELLRHKCILGITAIDAAVNTFWHEVLLDEWAELMTLIDTTLADEEELEALHHNCKDFFKKSQLVATLRFISHTGDPKSFSPNFADLACVMLLKKQTPFYPGLARHLVELQHQRNSALHTGRDWSEIMAHKCLKTIKACSEELSKLHFCFADAFQLNQPNDVQDHEEAA